MIKEHDRVVLTERVRAEGLEVILHDLVKDAAGRTTGFVARGRTGHPVQEAEGMPTSQLDTIRLAPVITVVRRCRSCAV
ncbi:MAG TPA: hypothetical protein VMO47_11775 [Rhodothermales bacterium]|nr:hypothetical protein [Rhodothermales bacterium]